MLRIADIAAKPIHRLGYLNARSGGGTESTVLEVLDGTVTGLGSDCAGIVVASDLQGIAMSLELGEMVLLGCALADHLAMLADAGVIPPASSLGVVLCGDLYSDPEARKRGGFGDVSPVWRSFAARFRWVIGVAGNHDSFGSARNERRVRALANLHLLDGEVICRDGIAFGGVGRIAGDPRKPGRRDHDEQHAAIEMVLDERPDVLILHEGPRGGPTQIGDHTIRAVIDNAHTSLTVCGHRHWKTPLANAGTKQFLNVDGRAVLLRANRCG